MALKILTVVGARPQFIKVAPFSSAISRAGIGEILVHTGQHYDFEMSDIFFQEMGIPKPQYQLSVGSKEHGQQTGAMMVDLEPIVLDEKPDAVVVFGDTNSTLAGALVAAKLYIPLVHVEAGLRSFNRKMPEEINRVLTDHVADVLFCPTSVAQENLAKEGIAQGVHVVGDIMVDAIQFFKPAAQKRQTLEPLQLAAKKYYLLTVHRPVNTDQDDNLKTILKACSQLPHKVFFPVHPRTRAKAEPFVAQLKIQDQIQLHEPVGYLDMLNLQSNASAIITDSGGVQKEAHCLQVPCFTLRQETEWVETLEGGWNQLLPIDEKTIISKIQQSKPPGTHRNIYGNGHAAEKMVAILMQSLKNPV